jgi:hypothetical protein
MMGDRLLARSLTLPDALQSAARMSVACAAWCLWKRSLDVSGLTRPTDQRGRVARLGEARGGSDLPSGSLCEVATLDIDARGPLHSPASAPRPGLAAGDGATGTA